MSLESWETFLGDTNFPLIEDTIDGTTYYELLSKLYKYAADNIETLETAVAGKQDSLTFDQTPTEGSNNPVTSGGVYDAIAAGGGTIVVDAELSTESVNPVQNKVITAALNNKEDTLTFDQTPSSGSTNPVTSGGVYNALSGKQNTLTFDSTPTSGSTNPVTSDGLYSAFSEKQDTLIFDTAPTSRSSNPVTSGGVYQSLINGSVTKVGTSTVGSTTHPIYLNAGVPTAITSAIAVSHGGTGVTALSTEPTAGSAAPITSEGVYNALLNKEDSLTWDLAPTEDSSNPVTSGGVYEALQEKEDTLTFDTEPTEDSTNPVTSGGVYDAIQSAVSPTYDTEPTQYSTNAVESGGVYTALLGKQDLLTFDSSPTEGSTNPVTSDGLYSAFSEKQDTLTFDTAPAYGSTNPVTSGGVYTALSAKENTVTWDQSPADGSSNGITSGAVYSALLNKEDALTFDSAPTEGSTNPVTSGGVYTALSGVGAIVDDELSLSSVNPVQNKVITAALNGKEDALTWDSTPTDGSLNPVTSGGLYNTYKSVDGSAAGLIALSTATYIYAGNIDTINSYGGYMLRCSTITSTGTFPTTILGGNSYLIIGFSRYVESSAGLQYGVQIAIGFSTPGIAIRTCDFNTAATGSWSVWSLIS